MPVAWCLTWLLQAVAAGDPLLIAVVPASSCSTISPLIGCYIRLPGTARESPWGGVMGEGRGGE